MASTILFIALLMSHPISSLKECTDYQHCLAQNITENGVSCSGYESCEQSQLIESTDDISCTGSSSCSQSKLRSKGGNIYCYGSNSCLRGSLRGRIITCSGTGACKLYEDNEITAKILLYCSGSHSCNRDYAIRAGNRIYCNGEYSCGDSQMKIGEQVYCNGEHSCHRAVIAPLNRRSTISSVVCSGGDSCAYAYINSVDTLNLYGYYSAMNSRITDVSLIRAYGFRSFQNGLIDSGSLTTMTVRAIGESAGYYGHVRCRNRATCNLICRDTGCNTLKYYCEGLATCNIEPSECGKRKLQNRANPRSIDGTICPEIIYGDIAPDTDEMGDVDEIDEQQQPETDTNMINIYADLQCDPNVVNGCKEKRLNDNIELKCNGLESCKSSIINTYHIGGAVRCHGDKSCLGATINTPRYFECSGYESCKDVRYDSEEVESIFCGGKHSCINIKSKRNSMGATRLWCDGHASCKRLEVVSGNNQGVICKGNRACYSSQINSSSEVTCNGQYSCAGSDIREYGSFDMECGGRGSCANSVIDANLVGTYDYLSISGQYGARKSTLTAPRIYGNGYYSLAYSTIDSKDRDTRVYASAHLAGYRSTFICRNGSICDLHCRGTGCRNMDYVCLNGATCTLTPSQCANVAQFDAVDCPNMLTNIPQENHYENDRIYQYQEWELQQDGELNDLLDGELNDVDTDIIERFLLFNSIKSDDLETETEEMELFGDIQNMIVPKYEYEMKTLFGICSVLFMIGSLIYLGYKMRTRKGEYQSLLHESNGYSAINTV